MKRNFTSLLRARHDKNKFVCVGLDMADLDRMKNVVRQTTDLVCAYKLNTEHFFAHGPAGFEWLHYLVAYIQAMAPEVPVILDRKAGDIGETNEKTAQMAFDFLHADAITVHPYFGGESLMPFLERSDKGVFVICRSSNPGASEFQDSCVQVDAHELQHIKITDAVPWSEGLGGCFTSFHNHVAHQAFHYWNTRGNCGLVVGATKSYPTELESVRKIVGETMPILVPGIGAQGGNLEQAVTAGKNRLGKGFIVSSSRQVILSDDPRGEVEKLNGTILAALKPEQIEN